MLAPSLRTYTGSLVNRIEEGLQAGGNASLVSAAVSRTCDGLAMAVTGTAEVAVSAIQFLALLVPLYVRKTLTWLKLQRAHQFIPAPADDAFSNLVRRIGGLALQATAGAALAIVVPSFSVSLYDSLGLERRDPDVDTWDLVVSKVTELWNQCLVTAKDVTADLHALSFQHPFYAGVLLLSTGILAYQAMRDPSNPPHIPPNPTSSPYDAWVDRIRDAWQQTTWYNIGLAFLLGATLGAIRRDTIKR